MLSPFREPLKFMMKPFWMVSRQRCLTSLPRRAMGLALVRLHIATACVPAIVDLAIGHVLAVDGEGAEVSPAPHGLVAVEPLQDLTNRCAVWSFDVHVELSLFPTGRHLGNARIHATAHGDVSPRRRTEVHHHVVGELPALEEDAATQIEGNSFREGVDHGDGLRGRIGRDRRGRGRATHAVLVDAVRAIVVYTVTHFRRTGIDGLVVIVTIRATVFLTNVAVVILVVIDGSRPADASVATSAGKRTRATASVVCRTARVANLRTVASIGTRATLAFAGRAIRLNRSGTFTCPELVAIVATRLRAVASIRTRATLAFAWITCRIRRTRAADRTVADVAAIRRTCRNQHETESRNQCLEIERHETPAFLLFCLWNP